MAHPQHNFTSNFNGSDGHNAELTLNINGVAKKYTPAGNDQTYNVPGVARIDINLDGADLVQAIQTALDGAAQPVLVEMSIYDEETAFQYIGDVDGYWWFGAGTVNKIVTIAVDKTDGSITSEQIPVTNGVVIVPNDGLNIYAQLRAAIALGQLPVLSYVGANPVYAQYEKTADNGDLIFVGALATASDTYVQYNIYTVSNDNTVTVTTRAASAGGGGTPDAENGFFNTSLYSTPGDGATKSIIIDDFRIKNGTSIHGSNIEFVPTHQEGGIDFGEVYLNPGTYILNIRYTLQWVGNPRGTFTPLVCRVGGQPFDFSFEQENTVITSQIRVVTARQKVAISFPFDADTPPMGIWVETLSIAQIASNTHPAVVHDTTLAGSGTAGSPLGVTTDAFGKVKDIPTSISQFRTGDVIPVDGPNGPAKMPKDSLLRETAQNTLAGNLAPKFVPNSTTTVAWQVYVYDGVLYMAKEAYQGPWDASKFEIIGVRAPVIRLNPNTSASPWNDLDTYPANSIVLVFIGQGNVSNRPSNVGAFTVYTFGSYGGVVTQILSSDDRVTYVRSKWNSWGSWITIKDNTVDTSIFYKRCGTLSSGAYGNDLDNMPGNTIYACLNNDIGAAFEHKPVGNDNQFIVSTFTAYNDSTNICKIQMYVTADSREMYIRSKWASWGPWVKIEAKEQTIYTDVLSAFNNIICVGDSLTYSQVYTSENSSRQAYRTYPDILGTITGATTTSYANCGDTATGAWNRHKNNFESKTNSLAIVYLGTNGGLTDTLATDAPENESYTDWASTNTGSYAKIVARLQELGYKILLVKVFASTGNIATTNSVIEQVAGRFGCSYVGPISNSAGKYHYWPDGTGSNSVHFNDFGYAWFAKVLSNSVSELPDVNLKKIIPA